MLRLVWSEFVNGIFGKTMTQWGTALANMLKTLLILTLFMGACSNECGNGLEFMSIYLIGLFLECEVADIVYMLPGKLEDYLYARLKVVIIVQYAILVAIQLVRGGMHFGGYRTWVFKEEVLVFIAYSIFIVLRSVWKFYKRYTYQPLFKETGAGVVAILTLGLVMTSTGIARSSEGVWLAVLALCVFLLIFTIGVCRFVKKNIVLTVKFGGENV